MADPDLTAELDAAEAIVMGGADPEPQSDHVAVSRIVLFGGHERELIHVDKAFLIAAIQDARSVVPRDGDAGDVDASLGQARRL